MLRFAPPCRSLPLLGVLCLGSSGLFAQGPNPEAREYPPVEASPAEARELSPVEASPAETSASLTGLPPEAAASLRQHIAQVRAVASERLGPTQPFSVHWQEGPFEVRHTSTALHLQSDRAPRDMSDAEGVAIIAQVAQAYTDGEGWLSRGATEYRQLLLSLALRDADTDDALRMLSQLYEAYREGRFAQDLASSRDPAWQGAGAALALYCLDSELRQTGNSFEALHRQSVRGEGFQEELFWEHLREADRQAADNLARRVSYRGVFDVHRCFEAGGLQVTAQARRRIDEAAWHRLLHGERVLGGPPTIAQVEGGPLRPGDRLRFVRGQRVQSWEDVARLIDGLPPYREIPVAVDRNGEQVVVVLAMVGLPRISGTRERFTLVVSREGLATSFPLLQPTPEMSLVQARAAQN